MREIKLTKGFTAVIDDEDWELVTAFSWYAHPVGRTVYAENKSRTRGHMSIHRLIMGAPEGLCVDHIDGDGLNNRRSNLRLATRRQNQHNRIGRTNSTSQYKGVYWNQISGRWIARVGGFESEEEAARAVDLIAPLAHGEFARLNFPDAGRVAA